MAASERVRLYGLNVVEGDLVALSPEAVSDTSIDEVLTVAEEIDESGKTYTFT